jgi:hypothetical protein
MGINLQDLIGGSITDGVAKIISLFKVDPTVALDKQTEVQEIVLKMQSDASAALAQQLHDQSLIDQTEAASPDKYTSRARPSILYICGLAFLSNYVVGPFATWIAGLCGHPIQYPTLDISTMQPVMLGLLGLTAGHVYENVKGVGQ